MNDNLSGVLRPGYREVTNYLRNELQINREFIELVVDKSINNKVMQYLDKKLNDQFLKPLIEKCVKEVITGSKASSYGYSPKDDFQKAVIAEVKIAVGKILEKDLSVEFKIKSVGELDDNRTS